MPPSGPIGAPENSDASDWAIVAGSLRQSIPEVLPVRLSSAEPSRLLRASLDRT